MRKPSPALAPHILATVSLLFGAALFLQSSTAHARRGFALITHGDDISHYADIPTDKQEEIKAATGAANPAIGYKYGQFGLFFLNIWTWDGEYVLYENDTFWDLGAEKAAELLGVSVDSLGKPFTYTFPPGLIVLLVLGLGFGGFVLLGSKKDE